MSEILDKYRAFAVDLDGVIWRGDAMIEGAVEALSQLLQCGKKVLMLTNNGAYTPESVVERLAAEGVALRESQILTSSMVAVDWLVANGLRGKAAMVLATSDVEAQFKAVVTTIPPRRGAEVAVVVVGRDLDFDFERLAAAAAAVRAGGRLIALNRDDVMPTENGFEPGTGAILAAIEAASGREAVVIGKPHLPMMQAAVARLGSTGVLMVGDRAESDVAGARAVGWDVALVLSGADSSPKEGEVASDYVAPSLFELIQ